MSTVSENKLMNYIPKSSFRYEDEDIAAFLTSSAAQRASLICLKIVKTVHLKLDTSCFNHKL